MLNLGHTITWAMLQLQIDAQKDFYNATNLHGYTTVSFEKE
jgi:hypothetical protein